MEQNNPFVTTRAALSAFRRARVLVVGDVMLDRYWFGDVSRISPEAPVPVVKVDRSEDRPGGAANVARNAAALGARVTLLSVVGQDEPGRRLRELLRQDKIVARLHNDRTIDTTVKLRVIGRQQQLLRVDFETAPSRETLRSKLTDYAKLVATCDVVILSDYGKGGLVHISRMIALARRLKKPVLVDPKGEDFARYAGAALITPNRSEFRTVTGKWANEREFTAHAQKLRSKLKVEALLVTRSEEGMTLFTRNTRRDRYPGSGNRGRRQPWRCGGTGQSRRRYRGRQVRHRCVHAAGIVSGAGIDRSAPFRLFLMPERAEFGANSR